MSDCATHFATGGKFGAFSAHPRASKTQAEVLFGRIF
jgi:hypothetical protein